MFTLPSKRASCPSLAHPVPLPPAHAAGKFHLQSCRANQRAIGRTIHSLSPRTNRRRRPRCIRSHRASGLRWRYRFNNSATHSLGLRRTRQLERLPRRHADLHSHRYRRHERSGKLGSQRHPRRKQHRRASFSGRCLYCTLCFARITEHHNHSDQHREHGLQCARRPSSP
jgi:hypothetical protein